MTSYTGREMEEIAARHRAEGRRISRMVIGIVALAGCVIGYMIRVGVA